MLTLPGTVFGAPAERLALRLSVCDYDGARALELTEHLANPTRAVAKLAPNVMEAVDAIRAFVTDLAA